MKNLLFIIGLVLPFGNWAQVSDSLQWVKKSELPISKNEIWEVDVLGNLYITSNKVINKYDSTNKIRFSQSIKSLGRLREIQSINTMKLVAFSEEQQTVCLLDNTLTLSEECIDLSNYSLDNASHIAISGQSDKIWVADQLNSKLVLLSLGGTDQFQEIKNLKGIINSAEISSIQEVNNQLFLRDVNGKIYQFDIYGSLLNMFDVASALDATLVDAILIELFDTHLVFQNILTDEKQVYNLPIEGVKEVKVSGDFFYFRTDEKIVKYSLTLKK